MSTDSPAYLGHGPIGVNIVTTNNQDGPWPRRRHFLHTDVFEEESSSEDEQRTEVCARPCTMFNCFLGLVKSGTPPTGCVQRGLLPDLEFPRFTKPECFVAPAPSRALSAPHTPLVSV